MLAGGSPITRDARHSCRQAPAGRVRGHIQRGRLALQRAYVASEGARDGWINYEGRIASASGHFKQPEIAERDLLTINYTSGTTSRPKGVMITHRNAWINSIGTLVHHPMTCADRYLWTLPIFHANGWTFV